MRVEHHPDELRFVARLPGGEAYVTYEPRGPRTIDVQHTIVPEAEQGGGVGSALVEHVLRHAREHDMRVIVSCPFVHHWLSGHPGWEDVVVDR